MKFKNKKTNAIEEPRNKDVAEMMKNFPDVYEPIEEKKK